MMQPTAKSVKPKQRGRADFFSWQLYRFLKKYEDRKIVIWSATWNSVHGVSEKRSLYIGFERSGETGEWIAARQLRNLCLAGQKLDVFAYSSCHDTNNWLDVTEWFWGEYLKKGVCAIHGDNAHNFIGGRCEYCGIQELGK